MLAIPIWSWVFFGAVLSIWGSGKLQKTIALISVGLAGLSLFGSHGQTISAMFSTYELTLFSADRWNMLFGAAFIILAFSALLYGFELAKRAEIPVALGYLGSALGAVFAGDLITLYIFWELMAVVSVMMILLGTGVNRHQAALRYILVHIVGGLILLAGILSHIHDTGTIQFTGFVNSTSAICILIGFLVNAAAWPFSAWLTDGYPETSAFGGVVLSGLTSKTAIYALLRGFAGWDSLIVIGCITIIISTIYAIFEHDIRRLLGFAIVNQGGFMVCAIGIGTPLALSGAITHAFCCVLYLGLLWMSAGLIQAETGTRSLKEISGLYGANKLLFAFTVVGAAAISAVPLFSGFTSKTLSIVAAEKAHLLWPWIVMEISSAAIVLHVGFRYVYNLFFGEKTSKKKITLSPWSIAGMGILSGVTILVGLFPELIYQQLAHIKIVHKSFGGNFLDVYIHHGVHVVTKLQLLIFALAGLWVCQPYLQKIKPGRSLDTDWFYRKSGPWLNQLLDQFLNTLNKSVEALVVKKWIPAVRKAVVGMPDLILPRQTRGYRSLQIAMIAAAIAVCLVISLQ